MGAFFEDQASQHHSSENRTRGKDIARSGRRTNCLKATLLRSCKTQQSEVTVMAATRLKNDCISVTVYINFFF